MAAHTNPTAVKRAVSDIQRFYEAGRKSLESYGNNLPRGKWVKLTADANMNRDRYLKCRQFAGTVSKPDLSKICRKIEKGGFSFGVEHIVRLMRLPGQQQRWSFLDRAIERRWSCRDLALAVRKETGRRPRAGRTPTVRNREEAVHKLIACTELWQRLKRFIMSEKNGIEAIGLQLSPAIRNELDACDSALNRLYKRLLKVR